MARFSERVHEDECKAGPLHEEAPVVPFYSPLKSHADGERIVAGLRRLRSQLDELPARSLSTMLLASWNIREFDSATYGPRTDDAYYFIAEIISRFDIVAVQEVRRDLRALKAVTRILGSDWDYMVTDTTEGRPGNQERLAYVFDTTRVRPSGLVGEIVIPPGVAGDNVQLARTPLTAGFQCGWAKFQLTTVHIVWGNDDENNPDRIREIDRLASFLADRAEDVQEIGDDNLVLLGDFNIFRPESATMEALLTHKWVIPESIQTLGGTNVAGNKKYDQIAVREQRHRFEPTGRAGIVDCYRSVFRTADADAYLKDRARPDDDPYAYPAWRTYQMSDHLPLWVEIDIDFADQYLDEIEAGYA